MSALHPSGNPYKDLITLPFLAQKRLMNWKMSLIGELGIGMSWANQQKQQMKLAKRYLKSDSKVRNMKTLNKFWTNLLTRLYTGHSLGSGRGGSGLIFRNSGW